MCCIRIERASNGYVVHATDPKIAAENQKPNSKWKDSDREYVFKELGAALEFIEKIAEIALPLDPEPPDPFSKAFNAAVKGGEDKD
jgi:hypothetical protein